MSNFPKKRTPYLRLVNQLQPFRRHVLIRGCASVPPPPGRLPPQIRKSVKSFFSPYFRSSEQPQSSFEQLLMRGTLGGTHRASIIDMIVDHHLASPGASPCPPPWLMKHLIHTLQSRHLAHLDGLWLLWIVSGAQKVPKTSRKRAWVDIQVNRVSESRIATPSTNTCHNRETPLVASCTQNRAVLRSGLDGDCCGS